MLPIVQEALERRDFASARTAAQQWAERSPEVADAHHLLAVARSALGQNAEALDSIETAIALAPDTSVFHVTKGAIALRMRRHDGAEAALHQAVVSDPNAFFAYVALAHLAIERGDLAAARQHSARAARIEPEAPDVLILHGIEAQTRGDLQAASALFNTAVRGAPDSALAHASLGLCLLVQGHHAFAEQSLQNALAIQPRNRGLRWALLRALSEQNRGEDALAQLNILVEQMPSDPTALHLRSEMLLQAGRIDEATSALTALLQLLPDHPLALSSLVHAYLAGGRQQDAMDLIEQRLAGAPGRDDLWALRARIETRDPGGNGDVAERWVAACPDSPMAQQAMAEWLELRGRLEEAEACADRALARDASCAAAQLIKLRAELRAQPDAAVARARTVLQAVQQPEARRSALHWYGLALDGVGDCAAAVQAWREMWEITASALPLPTSRSLPEAVPVVDALPVTLVWALPGAPVEHLIAPLAYSARHVLLGDRFSGAPRVDGLDPLKRGARDEVVPGSFAAWTAAIHAKGCATDNIIDWIPHWDRAVQAQFPLGRLIALVRDPRDLLLNWLAFNGPLNYQLADITIASQWLQHMLAPLLAFRDERPQQVLVLRGEEVESDRAGTLARIATFSGIEFRDEAQRAHSVAHASGRSRSGFAAGHWQAYAQVLAAPFASLQPLARALGYDGDAVA